MVRKKVEGNEDQRRAATHDAHRGGDTPSARGETTGASKQRTHVTHQRSLTHEDRIAPVHRGKQGARPAEVAGADLRGPAAEEPEGTFRGRGSPNYTDAHARVFQVLADAERQHGGEGVYLEDIARGAGPTHDETRTLLHDLVSVHRLVTELGGADRPDLGPRFEVKPRL